MEFTAPSTTDLGNGEAIKAQESANVTNLVALTDNNKLVSFDDHNPAASQFTDITGVEGTLLGIDTRPADGSIYGISTANNIYTIDADSGLASYVSTLNTPFEGGTISGFDFNPVADRLRLVGDNDQNFRINVDTGEVTVDGTLAFGSGDANEGVNPNVTAAAYTNSFDGTASTQLYNIDTLLNDLALQNPPNDGTLATVGDLGIDFDTLGGFEIVSATEGDNTAFTVSDTTLYSIDLNSGAAYSLGEVGSIDPLNLQGLTAIEKDLETQDENNAKPLIDLSDLNYSTVSITVNENTLSSGTIGFYEVNADGSVINSESGQTTAVGDSGYTQAAIANRLDIDLNLDGKSTEFTAEFTPGSTYAPFVVVDGTIAELEDGDHGNNPTIYFPYAGVNSDGMEHIRSLGGNTFGIENVQNSGDLNFDDLVVNFDFV
jgi:Domain of unknown function (DUF4394)/Domain of unknown function (DUF4114)